MTMVGTLACAGCRWRGGEPGGDPLDYRLRDVGKFALTGELPQASLYT
ncbi:hypothetical protein [Burkholderia vietnamiensis]|nr:hypothetical protein [Burkholderia vietnamiensis]MBR8149672.1 hypothetical protein [Burkholderia vietnamiensis]